MKQNRKTIIAFIGGVFLTLLFTLPLRSYVYAIVSTPDSGSESRLETLYNSLVSLGNGSDSSGGWGDWGVMWNRIRSSSEWVPSGDATAGDVVSGKTFYGGSRELITGSAPEPVDYSLQQFVEFDDLRGSWGGYPQDYMGEESSWTNTATDVWKDERSGLYWSITIGSYTNIFPNIDHSSCDFFSSEPRGSYMANLGDISDTDCGNAINACGALVLDSDDDAIDETDWYLPSQKELMQAYMDGISNHTSDFDVDEWTNSSTEDGGSWTYSWVVYMQSGQAESVNKTISHITRCVRRD